jgi:acetoin utilization protein AcuC
MKGINPGSDIPAEWIAKWQKQSPVPLPAFWSDPDDLYPSIPRRAEITEKNAQTVSKALHAIRNEQRQKTNQ